MSYRYESIHEERELNQFGLATFAHDAYNRFDAIADQAIRLLEKENEKTGEEYNNWEKMKVEDPERWKEVKEKADRSEIFLEGMVDSYMIDVLYRNEEMVALMEMKIIYAWKHLEIHIKKLIAAAYPGTDTKEFYKWNMLETFLKSRMIDMESLDGYPEVKQLLQANNKAKHTENMHEHLQHIPEFSGEYAISFENLQDFYNRVKYAPEWFLKALTTAIYKEIYQFDDEKLSELAREMALRMNGETAKKFMNMLRGLYQGEEVDKTSGG